MTRPKIDTTKRYKRVRKSEVQPGDAVTFESPISGCGYFRVVSGEPLGYYVGKKKSEQPRDPGPIPFKGARAYLIERPEQQVPAAPEPETEVVAEANGVGNIEYSIVARGGDENILIVIPGQEPLVRRNDQRNYEEIVKRARAQEFEGIEQLFDPSEEISKRFEPLSERVSVMNGRLYFDGDEVDNTLSKQILRFLDEDVTDWKPWVNFMEKVTLNPQQYSRTQLFDFLDRYNFTITSEGDIVGYKGVRSDDDPEIQYRSTSSGHATVDGVPHDGYIPNPLGAIVTMPRDLVQHNPTVGCSVGLHIGTYDFAKTYGDTLLEVHFNPRDVVSVPTDGWKKVRTCRYVVIGPADHEHKTPVLPAPDLDVQDPEIDLEEEICDECGESLSDCSGDHEQSY